MKFVATVLLLTIVPVIPLLPVFLVPLAAQEAKIIIVEKSDTAELKTAYREYQTALKNWEKVKTAVAKRYTMENGKIMEGWDRVSFSVDFRALVPEMSSGARWILPTATTASIANGIDFVNSIGEGRGLAVHYDGVDSSLKTVEKK